MPARLPADSARPPAPIPAITHDLAYSLVPQAQSQIGPRLIVRGLKRHWLAILALWLLVSALLVGLILVLVKPTYEAYCLLRVEPEEKQIFSGNFSDPTDIRLYMPYLQTQVRLITDNKVLGAAIANPKVVNLPVIKNSKDAAADLQEELTVVIVDKTTYLIRVALESQNPVHAAAIVNAVVDAYLEEHSLELRQRNRSLRENLTQEIAKLQDERAKKEAQLKALVRDGNVEMAKAQLSLRESHDDEDSSFQSSFVRVTEQEHSRARGSLLETEIQLLGAQADLDAAERIQKGVEAAGEGMPGRPADDLQARIEQEFQNDPVVTDLIGQINETKEQRDSVAGKARQPSDPARVAAVLRLKTLHDRYTALWNVKYDEIAAKLRAAALDPAMNPWEARVAELRTTVEKLKLMKNRLGDYIKTLETESKKKNDDTLNYTLLNQDMMSLLKMQDMYQQKLKQVEFDSRREDYHVSPVHRAEVPKTPSNNRRLKFMAAAPVGILFLMLGLFLMLEVKAERVADPEALSSRVQSEVYALPPLPTSLSTRRRGLPKTADQIEQFRQRLDHLRFALCGGAAGLDKGRCVMVTSAIGGEGKTNLAAQLAARCGEAGMSTLLIDADLRRTSLCTLLDVQDGPGLSDAILNDEPPPAELIVPVQGGIFHLLTAGTPVEDTNPVLQNRKFALLIGQFRQLYDLVIIDSPPVLPVPDALIIGRWVDGAVLAVRYDISRFPQVERARRQLDSAGIAVLGTVINGMRHSDSYYGRYSYNRRQAPQADPSTAP